MHHKISEINEQVAWQGFPTGQVDLILENWGHDDLVKKYITDQKVAVDLGPTGNQGIIGWYVPAWMAEKYPDITDYNNLNKYADLFKTSESGDKGQLLDGDPSYVTNDVALVKNLGLNYKVVTGGSEAALITAMQKATDNKRRCCSTSTSRSTRWPTSRSPASPSRPTPRAATPTRPRSPATTRRTR
jgi:glycine betaine/proline transport system substrate-binding protein